MLFEDYNNDDLLDQRFTLAEAMDQLRETLGRVDMEISRRMLVDNARAIITDRYEAYLNPGTPSLDYAKLVVLKEGAMVEEDLLSCYTPEHEETAMVPEKWSLVKLNQMARKYGDPVGSVLEGAKIPGRPTPLRVTPRK